MPSSATDHADLAARGPAPVGVLELDLPSPEDPLDPARILPCSVWYPADPTDAGAGRDDAVHPLGLPHAATPGLRPSATPRPLLAFSHGNSGLRQQSTFLTSHLASWGFVVVAPDHVGNTFAEMLALEDDEEARRTVHRRARTQRPVDLARTLRALLDEAPDDGALPPLRADAVGLMGHSFGGWTAIKAAALEPRARAVCALAPVAEPFVGRRAFAPGELPLRPGTETLVVAAEDDVLVDLETSIRPLHARLGPNARLELLERADHFHFCDGIELLHKMHENRPRPGQHRPTRPLAELRGERETHDWLTARVTRFFLDALEADASVHSLDAPRADASTHPLDAPRGDASDGQENA